MYAIRSYYEARRCSRNPQSQNPDNSSFSPWWQRCWCMARAVRVKRSSPATFISVPPGRTVPSSPSTAPPYLKICWRRCSSVTNGVPSPAPTSRHRASRITSYNVCYTKLLRIEKDAVETSSLGDFARIHDACLMRGTAFSFRRSR